MTILNQTDKSWPSFVLAISEISFLPTLKEKYGKEKLDAEQLAEIKEKKESFEKIPYHNWVAKSLAKWVVAHYDNNTKKPAKKALLRAKVALLTVRPAGNSKFTAGSGGWSYISRRVLESSGSVDKLGKLQRTMTRTPEIRSRNITIQQNNSHDVNLKQPNLNKKIIARDSSLQ